MGAMLGGDGGESMAEIMARLQGVRATQSQIAAAATQSAAGTSAGPGPSGR